MLANICSFSFVQIQTLTERAECLRSGFGKSIAFALFDKKINPHGVYLSIFSLYLTRLVPLRWRISFIREAWRWHEKTLERKRSEKTFSRGQSGGSGSVHCSFKITFLVQICRLFQKTLKVMFASITDGDRNSQLVRMLILDVSVVCRNVNCKHYLYIRVIIPWEMNQKNTLWQNDKESEKQFLDLFILLQTKS